MLLFLSTVGNWTTILSTVGSLMIFVILFAVIIICKICKNSPKYHNASHITTGSGTMSGGPEMHSLE